MALANLYVGFDAISQAAITSFVSAWRIWQVHSLPSSLLSHHAFVFNALTYLLPLIVELDLLVFHPCFVLKAYDSLEGASAGVL